MNDGQSNSGQSTTETAGSGPTHRIPSWPVRNPKYFSGSQIRFIYDQKPTSYRVYGIWGPPAGRPDVKRTKSDPGDHEPLSIADLTRHWTVHPLKSKVKTDEENSIEQPRRSSPRKRACPSADEEEAALTAQRSSERTSRGQGLSGGSKTPRTT